MDKIIKIENEIEVLEEQCKKLKEEKQNKRIRKATQKRYPNLDLTWFDFVENEFTVHPKGSHYIAGLEFTVYGLKNKSVALKDKGIIKSNKYKRWETKFTKEECELFYKEVLSVCGYLLFPCFRCEKHYQLEDLYIDTYGSYEKQTIIKQLNHYAVGQCKSCSEKEVKEFNAPEQYKPRIVDKGGRWKGSYKLSDGGGGLRD